MLSIVQSSLSSALSNPLGVSATARILEKQVAARHASVAPAYANFSGEDESGLASIIAADLANNAAYGLLSQLSSQESASLYAANQNILEAAYDYQLRAGQQLDVDL